MAAGTASTATFKESSTLGSRLLSIRTPVLIRIPWILRGIARGRCRLVRVHLGLFSGVAKEETQAVVMERGECGRRIRRICPFMIGNRVPCYVEIYCISRKSCDNHLKTSYARHSLERHSHHCRIQVPAHSLAALMCPFVLQNATLISDTFNRTAKRKAQSTTFNIL